MLSRCYDAFSLDANATRTTLDLTRHVIVGRCSNWNWNRLLANLDKDNAHDGVKSIRPEKQVTCLYLQTRNQHDALINQCKVYVLL